MRFLGTLLRVLAVLVGLWIFCCCFGATIISNAIESGVDAFKADFRIRDFVPRGEEVDLGVALVPQTLPAAEAVSTSWVASTLNPSRYAVSYGLAPRIARELQTQHQLFADQLGFKFVGGGAFTFTPTPECERALDCAQHELVRSNAESVAPLARRFLSRAKTAGLSPAQLTALVVTYVQELEYRRPPDVPFDIHPPALVARDRWGDCDSKAILAAMILEMCGVDAVVLTSDALQHAALGVALPGKGFGVHHKGRFYQYVEVTTPGWPIGVSAPQHRLARLWEAVPLRPDDAAPKRGRRKWR